MLSILVSMTKKGVIGRENKMPWRVKSESIMFRNITNGNTVIMGRKTYESIGRALPDRHNIVVSKTMRKASGVDVCRSIDEALAKAQAYGNAAFIVGGENLYRQTIPLVDRLYVSYMKGEFDGDKFFPEIDKSEWRIRSRQAFSDFEHVTYERKA